MEEYAWIAGGNQMLTHKRKIRAGGSGEVHEMYNEMTEECFARKLIRLTGRIRMEDIKTETRAIETFLNSKEHPHIIKVLSHGWLTRPFNCYIIDMELCDLDLHEYIYGERPDWISSWGESLESGINLSFLRRNAPLLDKLRNTFIIMAQIAKGVESIHQHSIVHRDIKPRNVLFSARHYTWKITDFGINAEATSKHVRTTKYARGTDSYRAPELLQEPPVFTNKVDIWALGCILYELACGAKAFSEEWNIHEAAATKLIPQINVPFLPSRWGSQLSSCVNELLTIDWHQRPRAATSFLLFHSYRQLLDPSVTRHFHHVSFIPSFPAWKSIVLSQPYDDNVYFYFQLSRFYDRPEDKEAAVEVWQELMYGQTEGEMELENVLLRMAQGHTVRGQVEAAIAIQKELLRRNPRDHIIADALSFSYKQTGDSSMEIEGWKRLLQIHPRICLLRDKYTEACNSAFKPLLIGRWVQMLLSMPNDADLKSRLVRACESDEEAELLSNWKMLLYKRPWHPWFQQRMSGVFDRIGDVDSAIEFWRELVMEWPNTPGLVERLEEACHWKSDMGAEIELWNGLLAKKPGLIWAQNKLSRAYQKQEDPKLAIRGWKNLCAKYPSDRALMAQLAAAYESGGDYDAAIPLWNELFITEPADMWLDKLLSALPLLSSSKAEIRIWKQLVHVNPDNGLLRDGFQSAILHRKGTGSFGWASGISRSLGKLFAKGNDEEESSPPTNLVFVDLDDYISTERFMATARLISRVPELAIRHSDRPSDELGGSVATTPELYGLLKPEVGAPSDLHERPGEAIRSVRFTDPPPSVGLGKRLPRPEIGLRRSSLGKQLPRPEVSLRRSNAVVARK